MTTVGVLAVGRPTFDIELGARRFRRARRVLADLEGVEVGGPPDVFTDLGEATAAARRLTDTKIHALVIVFATFADNCVVQAIDRATDVPLVLWSVPERRTGRQLALNSMCGAHLSAFELHRRGHRFETVHVDPWDDLAGPSIRRAIVDASATSAPRCRTAACAGAATTSDRLPRSPRSRADRIADGLVGALIGQVGRPPAGFTACEAEDSLLAATTGMCVDHIDVEQLFDVADDVDDERLAECRDELAEVAPPPDVPDLEAERSLRLRAALADLVDERGWDAVAVRCWPECLDVYGAAICAPLALTTASGVPAACEADLLGAATALLLRRVSGGDPFVTDVVDVDSSDDTMAVWHCGSASHRWAGTPVEVTGHPIKHVGLAHHFALRSGPVTVARLSRSDGDDLSLWTGTARMVDRPRPFTGTCGVLQWTSPVDDIRRDLLAAGVEHHLVVVAGEHEDVLAELADRWGIDHHRIGHRPPMAIAGDRRGPELVAAQHRHH